MKKSLITGLFTLVLITLFGISFTYAQSVPGLSVHSNKKSYAPGSSGVLTIKFKTASNVKIPKDPPIEVNISGDGVSGSGLQDYSGGDDDYIDSKTIKYNFTVSNDAESGTSITITGTVKFGYCNSESGICKIGNKSFSVKISIQ